MIQPKDLILDALNHKKTKQVPWVPFAGVHAGTLAGYDATEVLTDGDKLFASLMEVNKLYRPCGQPVVFDLQLEAEILGCQLLWTKDGPPSVSSHPLEDNPAVPCRCTLPTADDGRLPMILDVMRRMKTAVGETTALYGLICGPFTLASHLRGNDIFMDMFDDEDFVHSLLDYCVDVGKRMTELYTDAGMDIIAVVDPLVSQVSAAHFEEFLSKPFNMLFDYIRERDRLSSFFVCGDATRNIEVMCKTNPDSVFVDENVNIVEAKVITDRYNIALGGNIPLTSIMLHGTQQDNMKYVVDMLDGLTDIDNFIVAPGCDMPFAVPVENTVAVSQAVWQTDKVREMLKNYVSIQDDIDVELPDYNMLSKPLLEVFTLDSATCAACTYMMGAANAAKEFYGDTIDVVEYKYTIKENIARCKKMGIKHLPSLYLNGQLKFSSLIPRREELEAAIDEAIASTASKG
ncbi:MAG: uroporphyrinogen decarboxylase family protein [Oscillospiraceae bacterium]|nr:uroporphyrinogen decarboxylase family protein [Oscillospiraceae bacterium]MDD4414309.1 uroporphyrinogen decarboxylase family protein [Oscillospiraceae bacterium]